MGQAKRRGSYEQRKEEAIQSGKPSYKNVVIPLGNPDTLTLLELGLYDKRPDGWRKIKV